MLMGGGAYGPHIFPETQESWSKVGHVAKEIVTVFSVTFIFLSNSNWSNGQNAPLYSNEKCLGISLL